MAFDILFCLCPVQMRECTVHIDPLADRRVPLKFQLVIPQFCLPYEHDGHGTYRIEPVVQKETEFLQCFFLQQVRLIQNAYHLFMLDNVDDLDLLLESPR